MLEAEIWCNILLFVGIKNTTDIICGFAYISFSGCRNWSVSCGRSESTSKFVTCDRVRGTIVCISCSTVCNPKAVPLSTVDIEFSSASVKILERKVILER